MTAPQAQNNPQPLRFTFRRAAMADMPRIMDVFSRSFKDQIPAEWMPWYKSVFEEQMNSASACFTVAAQDKRIVGFTVLEAGQYANAVYLGVIGVDPALQRAGLGKALMQQAERDAAGSAPYMVFHVREDNVSALNFYTKLGYRAVGIQKNAYTWDGVDAIVMSKPLAARAQDNTPRQAPPPAP